MGAILTRELNAFVACVSIAFGALKGPLTVSKWVRDEGGARLFKFSSAMWRDRHCSWKYRITVR
jgi:hypothetical protein